MNKAWNIFKEYYLLDAVVYGGALAFVGILAFSDKNLSFKFYVYYFGCFIPLFILFTGSLGYIKYEVWRPHVIQKKFKKRPFSNLKMKGFKQLNNRLIGKIKGYSVLVEIEWENYQKQPYYYFKVLYNPRSLNRFITFKEFEKYNVLNEPNAYYISPNSIELFLTKKKLSKYNYRRLLKDINNMIDFLKLKQLSAISHQNWNYSSIESEILERDYLSKIEF